MHVFVLIADLSVLCPLGLPYASLAVRQLALGMSMCGQAYVSVCVCVCVFVNLLIWVLVCCYCDCVCMKKVGTEILIGTVSTNVSLHLGTFTM